MRVVGAQASAEEFSLQVDVGQFVHSIKPGVKPFEIGDHVTG